MKIPYRGDDVMIRVSNLKLKIEDRGKFLIAVCNKLNINKNDIKSYKLVRESFDARRRHQCYVYTVDIEIDNEEAILNKNIKNVTKTKEYKYLFPNVANSKSQKSSIVVGSGPCGLFAAYTLAKAGYKPLLLERGEDVDKRVKTVMKFWNDGELDKNSNVQFGEGGAGTFSDGKLTTNIKNPRCNYVLNTFVSHGAPNSILYSYQPHIGTDNLRKIVKSMRKEISRCEGSVRFNSLVTDLIIKDSKIVGVVINDKEELYADKVLLATGHSARDTYKMLYSRGIAIEPKAFSMGFRIEHLQSELNFSQYGEYFENPNLDPATYKLKYHSKSGRSAYSFCMCPGGLVVASSSDQGQVVTNGMSFYSRAGKNANSAILVGIDPKDYDGKDALSGVRFQEEWESKAYKLGGSNFYAPVQLVGDFLDDNISTFFGKVQPTYKPGTKFANLKYAMPDYVTETLKEALLHWDRQITGFAASDSILTGIESRSSSPLRILRGKDMQTNIEGLYVGGEGAGYAGGIVSAAVDGVRLAEYISGSGEQN